MKDFFKSFWAALLAIIAAGILFFVVMSLIFAGAMSSFSNNVSVKPNSVLVLNFSENIVDAPVSSAVSMMNLNMNGFSISKSLSMLQVLAAIDNAKYDNNIKGIYIYLNGGGNVEGTAQLEELRNALTAFKESGKFIVSYNSSYTQGGYWLSSVADKIYLNPEGTVDWRGLSSSVIFYKGLIDKLGLDVDIIRHGTFKSAVEPFMTDKMSPANRFQMQKLVESIWTCLLDDVSSARGIEKALLEEYADNLSLVTAQDAKEKGFVDDVLYEDQVNSILAGMTGADTVQGETNDEIGVNGKFESVTLGDYVAQTMINGKKISKNKVAIIYANGQIMSGNGNDGVYSLSIMKKLEQVRDDKNVKAVVLRVNSPGGSSLASEEIWRSINLLRAEKPVIVSMSCYAASGGYYISCPADVILADKTTLTGSIGVYGIMFSVGNALKDKVGITTNVVKTAAYADMGNGLRPLQSAEIEYMTKSVEDVYKTFVNHVAEGRNMTYEAVDKIGEGRVWSGVEAADIGLVDGFGGLTDAIALAADRAGVMEDFRITEIKDPTDGFTALMQQLYMKVKTTVSGNMVADEMVGYYKQIMRLVEEQGVQAIMPYFVKIN